MQPIRAGLLGYGLAGATFHAPLLAADPSYRLSVIVTRRPEAVAQGGTGARVVADPEEVFADPEVDLVVIATPNDTHAALAERALAAGKHVVVDKPFTVTTAEAEGLIALAKRRGLCLSVFQCRRWDSGFLTVQGLIAEKRLGNLYSFESHYDRFRPEVRARWKEGSGPGAGTLYDLGAHLIDQALVLFGMPESVLADLEKQRPSALATDYVHLSLRYGKLRVLLHSGSVVSGPWPRFVLEGDKGSYSKRGMDPQEDQLRAGMRPDHPSFGVEPAEHQGELSTGERVPTSRGDYPQFYRELARAIHGAGPVPVTAESAAAVIRVIEAAEKSSAEGHRVTLG